MSSCDYFQEQIWQLLVGYQLPGTYFWRGLYRQVQEKKVVLLLSELPLQELLAYLDAINDPKQSWKSLGSDLFGYVVLTCVLYLIVLDLNRAFIDWLRSVAFVSLSGAIACRLWDFFAYHKTVALLKAAIELSYSYHSDNWLWASKQEWN